MLFLTALALAVCFALLCGKPLKKAPYPFYAAAAILAVGTVLLAGADLRAVPAVVTDHVFALFTRGALATALWCVVMWTGAFPNGSAAVRKLLPIRGELSITAAILTLGHNIGFGQTYFVRLFTDSSRMSASQITASILTIVMLLIMLPLTVMSFPQVRKKMKPKLWKRLQRTAYLFYALIYAHVMILCVPLARMGRPGYFFSIVVYSAVFLGYAVCRLRKWYMLRKKPEQKAPANAITACTFVALAAIALLAARPEAVRTQAQIPAATTAETAVPTEETTVPETTEAATSASTEATSETTVSTETTETTAETTDTTETETEETTETETVTEAISPEVPAGQQPEEPGQPAEQPQPQPEPEPVYVYRNGTYTATAYGYDGDVEVTVTIENDVILSVTARSFESDTWYFDSAQGSVISQILERQTPYVDTYSGATYSSNAIMSAVQKALDSARN